MSSVQMSHLHPCLPPFHLKRSLSTTHPSNALHPFLVAWFSSEQHLSWIICLLTVFLQKINSIKQRYWLFIDVRLAPGSTAQYSGLSINIYWVAKHCYIYYLRNIKGKPRNHVLYVETLILVSSWDYIFFLNYWMYERVLVANWIQEL